MTGLKNRTLPKGLKIERFRANNGISIIYVFVGQEQFGIVTHYPKQWEIDSVGRCYKAHSHANNETLTFHTLRGAVLFASMPVMPINPAFIDELLTA